MRLPTNYRPRHHSGAYDDRRHPRTLTVYWSYWSRGYWTRGVDYSYALDQHDQGPPTPVILAQAARDHDLPLDHVRIEGHYLTPLPSPMPRHARPVWST